MFDRINELSAPGSRLATEYHRDGMPLLEKRAKAMAKRWGQFGFDTDVSALVYHGERTPAAEYLSAAGWQITPRTRADQFAEAGLPVPPGQGLAALENHISVVAVLQ